MKKLFFTLLIFPFLLPAAIAQCDSLFTDSAMNRIACAGEKMLLNLDVYSYRDGGTWSSLELENFTGASLTRSFNYSQYLTYTYTDADNTCTASDSIYIKINPLPTVSLAKPADVCANQDCFRLLLNASPLGGSWSALTGTSQSVKSGEFCPRKVKLPSSETPVSIALAYTYTDANTCTSTELTSILVRPVPNIKLKDTVQMAVKDSLLNLDDLVKQEGKEKTLWSGDGIILDTDGLWKFSASEVSNTKGFYELIYRYTRTTSLPRCSEVDTILLELVDQVVSIPESEDAAQLRVFPNPSNGVVSVQGQHAFQYRIYDATGRIVDASTSLNNNVQINLQEGMYWLSATYPNGQVQTQRILIQ